MTAATPFALSTTTQEGLIQFHKAAFISLYSKWNLRDYLEKIDRAYLREADFNYDSAVASRQNAIGDFSRYRNITIPIIKPQVYSAVAYQAGIFLTDYPIFDVVSGPDGIDAARSFRAVIEENSIRRGWTRELLLFLIDGFKYNLSAVEVSWDKITIPALETSPTMREAIPTDIIWEGNSFERYDLYNTWFDSTVIPFEIPDKGVFVGTSKLLTRIALLKFMQSLPRGSVLNEAQSLESSYGLAGLESYFVPNLSADTAAESDPKRNPDWMNWASIPSAPVTKQSHNQHYNIYELTKLYVRIVPSEFSMSVPARTTPQVWKLYIVNHSVIIYAERQTNAHEKIPVFFGQPAEDGLRYQSKSLASDALPFQDLTTSLMGSVIAARRRAVTDRVLYDPSRVSAEHINSPNPAAKIPVRPSAYGKPISESVYQFPYRDDQSAIALQEIPTLVNMANLLNGQNPVRQGQFIKGNKTNQQFAETIQNASSRDQLTALLYEAQVFTPIKEVLKLNILQYQGPSSVYSPSAKQEIRVDPVQLRRASINFKFTDGLLPKEKVISTESLKVALQVIGSSPTLAASYNVAPLFSYLMKVENVDLAPFEKSQEQLAYEQAMNQWIQASQMAAQKGTPFSVPQPLPSDFNFNPASGTPAPANASNQSPV